MSRRDWDTTSTGDLELWVERWREVLAETEEDVMYARFYSETDGQELRDRCQQLIETIHSAERELRRRYAGQETTSASAS